VSERGLGRGLDHLIEQNATELGFLDAYGPTPDEALGEIFDAACRALSSLGGAGDDTSFETDGLRLERLEVGTRLTWSDANLPLVTSDLRLPGMREGHLSNERDAAVVTFVDWTHEVRRFLERAVEHHSSVA
jgi:hypothetical protein